MDAAGWLDFLTKFGVGAVFLPIALYLGNFIMTRYDKDIQSRTDLAVALNQLAKIIEEHSRAGR